ncbi:OX-2 membrane glycoprotein [Denticeps clupeoides]|uniref:Ig-like domain-containing protein n=1 Tax=Denticeps clupeoides TaxID=299321 RepID=A0AAY4B6D8_9TELE|nr:OX-2 membrane glycoprotein-like [Denticeps clupeoides]
MCQTLLHHCLRLCLLLMLVSRLEGEVVAPSHVHAVAGLPFIMGCNVTIASGQSLKQVRWQDSHGRTILSYLASTPSTVTGVGRVELATFHSHTSAITIKRATLQDEGCYHCIFDIYPTGAQEGKTCLSVTARVDLEGNKTVVSGTSASLSCKYGLAERVRQVLWSKTAEQGDTTTVASFIRHSRPVIQDAYQGHVSLSRSLGETRLFLKPVSTEDEGCYTCEFHTYPDGAKSATACISVYVLPKPEVSHVPVSPGIVEVNCTTVSRPASEITWNVEGDNRTVGPSVSSYFEQGDGTTLVIGTILVQERLFEDKTIKCLVRHQGLESRLAVAVNKIRRTHIILIIMVCVAVLLLLCLCVCLCKCSSCCS